jgi:hypothetical protein
LASTRFNSFAKFFIVDCIRCVTAYLWRMRNPAVLLAIGLAASGCVPSTPQARIQQSPALYSALAAKDQRLVQQGEIAKGMSQDAVFLAWGSPNMRYEGFQKGKTSERWDYAGSYPVYSNTYYGSYGYRNYGRYGHHGAPYYANGIAQELTYVPYRRASVWFVNQRVDSWERMR